MNAPLFTARADEAREPSTRSFLGDWTLDRLRAAEAQADYGSLRLAGELCEAMRTDDRVKGVLSTRSNGLVRLKLGFGQGRGIRRKRESAVRAIEAGEDFWAACTEDALVQLLEWGILLGVGLARIVPTERPNGRVVPRLEVRDPRWLRYDVYARRWYLTVEGGEIPIDPGNGTWVLYTPYGSNRPWAYGAWRAAARWWIAKMLAREDYGRASEVYGQPIRVGLTPANATPEMRKELARDLKRLGRDTAIALPPGFSLELVEATAKTHEMFEGQIALANVALAVVLVGQNLSTEVSGGSFAAATVHNAVRGDLIGADAETLSTTLHDQVFTWWAEWNFGDSQLAPWPEWETDPPGDKLAELDGLLKFAQAVPGLLAAGVDPRALAERFGYPLLPVLPPAVPSLPGEPTPNPAPPAVTRAA